MDKKLVSNNINNLISLVNNVIQDLQEMMVIGEIPEFQNIMLNNEYNLQAYQEIDEAFNFAIKVINTLVEISWELKVEKLTTGESIEKLKPFRLDDIQEKQVEELMSGELSEFKSKFDEVYELLITYGYVEERK
ncbi:hypothetical protein WOSG25_270050 [Weissella oryzae SG25]|uniref:Uncharacterized protein n=1 Tax=Weissella oryzae (strain DSM 25784 / JCM 18191 / LMG 30913 / SG25) TaxID=1329250 RepID=A0A069CX53_WEIOS|nr:hypothetical protein [Weissella oryzae]GAK32059.1 hypothetical protein WOSG25_270050 [Weissella oryzae SG25]